MAWKKKVWRQLAYFIKGVKPGLIRLLNFQIHDWLQYTGYKTPLEFSKM